MVHKGDDLQSQTHLSISFQIHLHLQRDFVLRFHIFYGYIMPSCCTVLQLSHFLFIWAKIAWQAFKRPSLYMAELLKHCLNVYISHTKKTKLHMNIFQMYCQ